MIDRDQLSELSKWAGLVSIMTIIFGAFSALFGILAYVVGAIPGIIMIILGVKLRNAKSSADALIASGEEDVAGINILFTNLNSYFKLQGILLIVSLAMIILGLIFAVVAGIAFMRYIY